MRLLISFFLSSHTFSVLCLAVCLLSGVVVIAPPLPNQELGHLNPPDQHLSPNIILSEILDAKGKGTGVRFLTIGSKRFCKVSKVADSIKPPIRASEPKTIGQVHFVSEAKMTAALSEARAYAEGAPYPKPSKSNSLDYLTYLDNVLEYLHMTLFDAINDRTMESWKQELKDLGSGESIVPDNHTDRNFGSSDISESPTGSLITVSEVLNVYKEGTGARFLRIGQKCVCKEKGVVAKLEIGTKSASEPKTIGHINFKPEGEELDKALAEAIAYAEGIQYPTPALDSLNYLTYLNHVMEHLYNREPRAIDDRTMESWKKELKRLKALDGERIILNVYHFSASYNPNGIITMQIGDDVLQVSLATKLATNNGGIRSIILGPLEKDVRIDLDQVREYAESHSGFCGAESDVAILKAEEAEWLQKSNSARMKLGLAGWKFANGVMNFLSTQGFVSKKISDKWHKVCPQRMNTFITYTKSTLRIPKQTGKRDSRGSEGFESSTKKPSLSKPKLTKRN
ncbi:hypothetical protein EV360DRAFT_82148 [Lentinula raphanica]|nr:hypothetical protein EV360DRAFT_82148 [Lentinula raphanica]